MKKIHILGSNGFIGSYLKQHLQVQNYSVVGYSKDDCDLSDTEKVLKLSECIDQGDVLVFASAITRLRENTENSMNKNIQMAINVSYLLDITPLKQMIYLNTIDVYTKTDTLITENTRIMPKDYYSKSKLVCEYILESACNRNKVVFLVFRLSGVYGEGDSIKSTMHQLVHSAIVNKEMILTNGGNSYRDFVYVNDLMKLLEYSVIASTQGVFNVATGKSDKIVDYAKMVQEVIKDSKITFNDQNQGRDYNLRFDNRKLKEHYPFFEFTDRNIAIREYVGWHINK